MTEVIDKSTLNETEFHPAASYAMHYVMGKMANIRSWIMFKESVASTALSGDRTSEIMMGTIGRLESSQPVSDRYLLGLAWFLKMMDETSEEKDFCVDEDTVFWAFRYALGRRTGAVMHMVGIIKENWQLLEPHTRKQMKDEIIKAIDENRAGDDCDVEKWQEILKLKGKNDEST